MNRIGYMMLIAVSLCTYSYSNAQLLPGGRVYEWERAGLHEARPSYDITLNILDFGGDNTGATSSQNSLNNAIASLNNQAGIIYFPEGNYLFTQPIELPGKIILRGASNETTTIRFNFGSGSINDQISIWGNVSDTISGLTSLAIKNNNYLVVDSSHLFYSNDYIQLKQIDTAIVRSDWAWNSSGQIFKITAIVNDTLFLDSKIRRNYSPIDSIWIEKLHMKSFVGIESLRFINNTETLIQTSVLNFNYAANCWVSCVESDSCNFAHISLSRSTNIEVKDSYFRRAYGYGVGGEGYGVSLEYTSGECLLVNNIFSDLRHAIVIQSGANGNAVLYNYAANPRFVGDIVFHGNYPYANLIEGNTVPSIGIDNSHYINGPNNFIYRNRAYALGIMTALTSISDSQSFVANEITNIEFGSLVITGAGQLNEWNNVKNNLITTPPNGLLIPSFYYNSKPTFFFTTDQWPAIGYPAPYNDYKIPAEKRYLQGTYTPCIQAILSTEKEKLKPNISIAPNPAKDYITLHNLPNNTKQIAVYSAIGVLVKEYNYSTSTITFENLPHGLYQIRISTDNSVENLPLLIEK